jgi:hypothetical protein
VCEMTVIRPGFWRPGIVIPCAMLIGLFGAGAVSEFGRGDWREGVLAVLGPVVVGLICGSGSGRYGWRSAKA